MCSEKLLHTLPMPVELVEHVARITVMQAGRTCERSAVVEEIVTVALIANIVVGHRMPFQRKVIGQNTARREGSFKRSTGGSLTLRRHRICERVDRDRGKQQR